MASPRADFEPIIHFPSDPLNAARRYFGVMAYPEVGAGQPGGAGAAFAASLWDYAVWGRRRALGLPDIRRAFQDDKFRPPEWRSFAKRMNQGLDRVRRRLAVHDLFQRRQWVAMSKSWGKQFTTMQFGEAMPSWGSILNRDVDGWQTRAALNKTGPGADKTSTAKDFRRRVIGPSLPVIRMAHGLSIASVDASENIRDWERRDPLLALLLNADLWVFEALDHAIKFREISAFPGFHGELTPAHMIELVPPEIGNEMPPADRRAD